MKITYELTDREKGLLRFIVENKGFITSESKYDAIKKQYQVEWQMFCDKNIVYHSNAQSHGAYARYEFTELGLRLSAANVPLIVVDTSAKYPFDIWKTIKTGLVSKSLFEMIQQFNIPYDKKSEALIKSDLWDMSDCKPSKPKKLGLVTGRQMGYGGYWVHKETFVKKLATIGCVPVENDVIVYAYLDCLKNDNFPSQLQTVFLTKNAVMSTKSQSLLGFMGKKIYQTSHGSDMLGTDEAIIFEVLS